MKKTYIALFSGDPERRSNEIKKLKRQQVLWEKFQGGMFNKNEISFGEVASNLGDATHFGLLDSIQNGNLIRHGELRNFLYLCKGCIPKFESGKLQILNESNV